MLFWYIFLYGRKCLYQEQQRLEKHIKYHKNSLYFKYVFLCIERNVKKLEYFNGVSLTWVLKYVLDLNFNSIKVLLLNLSPLFPPLIVVHIKRFLNCHVCSMITIKHWQECLFPSFINWCFIMIKANVENCQFIYEEKRSIKFIYLNA